MSSYELDRRQFLVLAAKVGIGLFAGNVYASQLQTEEDHSIYISQEISSILRHRMRTYDEITQRLEDLTKYVISDFPIGLVRLDIRIGDGDVMKQTNKSFYAITEDGFYDALKPNNPITLENKKKNSPDSFFLRIRESINRQRTIQYIFSFKDIYVSARDMSLLPIQEQIPKESVLSRQLWLTTQIQTNNETRVHIRTADFLGIRDGMTHVPNIDLHYDFESQIHPSGFMFSTENHTMQLYDRHVVIKEKDAKLTYKILANRIGGLIKI